MSHPIIRRLALAGIAACALALTLPSTVLAQQAIPIAEALERLKINDVFIVDGTIVDSFGTDVFWIEDESGKMPIKIKEHMIREHGEIKRNDRLRVWGTFAGKKLDKDVHGMMVSRIYRLPEEDGMAGANNPGANASTEITPIDRSALPAAPAGGAPDVMKPMATEEFKQRVRARMVAYRQAEKDAVTAGEDYARAAREAGSDGQVDPALLERLQSAEARVVEIRSSIPAIMNEARAAGVNEGVIEMIEMETGLR